MPFRTQGRSITLPSSFRFRICREVARPSADHTMLYAKSYREFAR